MLEVSVARKAEVPPPAARKMFIGGKWTRGASNEEISRYAPGDGKLISTVPAGTRLDVEAAVVAAREAFDDGRWSGLSSQARADVLHAAARLIQEEADELALWETLETGKPITQSRTEILDAALTWRYAAGLAQTLRGDTFNNLGSDQFGMVIREPVGVVGVITPWNFPFFILAERIPFILASGCTVVVKPSEFTSSTTLRMAAILQSAGLPDGCFNVLTGYGEPVGSSIVEHPGVDMVTFTGSTRVGRSTLQASTGNLKRVGLELGGKNPQIVFADADLDAAAKAIAFGITYNAGQCCVSGSRLLAHASIERSLTEKVLAELSRIRFGDLLDPETEIGAIVNEHQLESILGHIEAGRRSAKLLAGGDRVARAGLFVEPAVFGDVDMSHSIANDEIFGPVLAILKFSDFEDAVRIANATQYGLAASVWTASASVALQAARRVRAGRVWINTTLSGGPEMPVGGFKQSGIGRDAGTYGVEAYTEVKSVLMSLPSGPA